MKTKTLILNLLVTVAVALGSGAGYAADTAPMMDKPMSSGMGMQVVVEGVNDCLGCALKMQGAQAACAKNGHQQALKVTKAMTPDGKPLPELEGCTLHYLNTPQGVELTSGAKYHGKKLSLTGMVFKDERVLDVSKIDMAGAKPMGGMDKPMEKPADGKMKEPMSKKN